MSKRLIRTLALAAAAIAVPVTAAGCGSSSSNNTAANPTTETTTKSAAAANGTVAVTLNEMNIIPAPDSAQAGKVTFDVKNGGQLPHEMVVLKTEKKADALGSGQTVPEAGSVGETGDVAAGASKKLTLNLKKGHYALICNIPGHYAAGMHADFTVN